jgi:hypothetical protein
VYSNGVYTTLEGPGATNQPYNVTDAQSVDANGDVAGYYVDSTGQHGFLYQPDVSAVPEPSTLTLLGIGAVCSLGYEWRRRRQGA